MEKSAKLGAVILSALIVFAPLGLAYGEADDTTEPTRKAEVARTPLVTLKERESVTVAVTRLARSRIDLVLVAEFYDETGRRVGVQRGQLNGERPTFVATLSHDELERFDSALIRSVIKTATVQATSGPANCPIGTSVDTTSGPVLAWTGNPCDCGPPTGGHVFLTCPPPVPGDIGTSRD